MLGFGGSSALSRRQPYTSNALPDLEYQWLVRGVCRIPGGIADRLGYISNPAAISATLHFSNCYSRVEEVAEGLCDLERWRLSLYRWYESASASALYTLPISRLKSCFSGPYTVLGPWFEALRSGPGMSRAVDRQVSGDQELSLNCMYSSYIPK
jgi:hypothetical protein